MKYCEKQEQNNRKEGNTEAEIEVFRLLHFRHIFSRIPQFRIQKKREVSNLNGGMCTTEAVPSNLIKFSTIVVITVIEDVHSG